MGLFGKKKKEINPEDVNFGFPATSQRREVEPVTPPLPNEQPLPPPIQKPTIPQPQPIQMPQQPQPQPVQQPQPQPELPKLAERPVVPVTTPDEIDAPSAPVIQKLRPHVFLKISKYKEVMSSIDRILIHIKDLKKSLRNMKEVEEKEAQRIKDNEDLLIKLEEIANTFDKIFSNPEK